VIIAGLLNGVGADPGGGELIAHGSGPELPGWETVLCIVTYVDTLLTFDDSNVHKAV
jgi:hypothetical protein